MPPALAAAPRSRHVPLLLIGLTLLVFGQSIAFEFVTLDDSLYVFGNPLLHPVSIAHLRAFWASPYHDVYEPVAFMVWAAVAHFAQVSTPDSMGIDFNAQLFHLLNIALHVAAVLLVWRILSRVSTDAWAAAAGAAVFAVHPLQVESVAWVSSGKDALSGALALGAILSYLRFAERRRWRDYAAGLAFFLLAMLSKATACAAPAMLLLFLTIVHVPDRRRAMLWVWPWFVAAVPILLLTRHAQSSAAVLVWSPWLDRPGIALDALSFYLGKLLWPTALAMDYGRTPQWVMQHRAAWALWPLPAIAVAALLLWRCRPAGVFIGVSIFTIGLMPVLGLIPFEFQLYSTVADRYVYLPMLGIAVAAALIAARLHSSKQGLLIILPIALLLIASVVQTGVWASSETLFQHAVEVQPRSGFGWQGIGGVRGRAGDWRGAIDAYQRALSIRPDDTQAMADLAGAYKNEGDDADFRLAHAALAREIARRRRLIDSMSSAEDAPPSKTLRRDK